MTRAVVNVATGARYLRGQERLRAAVLKQANSDYRIYFDRDLEHFSPRLPRCPSHSDVPYAFKAFALASAVRPESDLLLWADASILPIRSLEPIWERIERDGYWMSDNGYSNATWTADSAYYDLFEDEINAATIAGKSEIKTVREINRKIQHVVATAFGLNVRHPKGKAFLDEYYRLASETRAFCGPWWNKNSPEDAGKLGAAPCGPPDVRGHRHDQTAASVIAWRLGFELTQPPEYLAYRGRETDKTILVVDGGF